MNIKWMDGQQSQVIIPNLDKMQTYTMKSNAASYPYPEGGHEQKVNGGVTVSGNLS